MTDDVVAVLARVTAALPGGGERRDGQRQMASEVGRAIAEGRHLVVQAGTGTGKSLAYLIPAALSDQPIVVATATKALQDQLATNDLPLVAGAIDRPLSYAVLKGRSNYLCRQRVAEVDVGGQQLSLATDGAGPPDAEDRFTRDPGDRAGDGGGFGDQVKRLIRWAEVTDTGDRAELEFEPHFRAWATVSTTAGECPGAFRCPSGGDCFAEDARARAAAADVVVVNTHLYGAHLASGGAVLPPHQVVVFDEAHQLEEVMTDSLGVEIAPGRFRALAASARPVLDADSPGTVEAVDGVAELGDLFQRVLGPLAGPRISDRGTDITMAEGSEPGPDPALPDALALATGRVGRLTDILRRAEREGGGEPGELSARRDRVLLAAGHLATDLGRVIGGRSGEVVWVDGGSRTAILRLSPIDVGPLLSEQL